MTRQPTELEGTKMLPLEDSLSDSLMLETSRKAAVRKPPRLYEGDTHLLILRGFLEGWRPVR